ncbi:hypothetical protein E5358_07280 [Palleniella muris]|uniref:Uncharacterized protein n=1 Tax=Palleniella muris TaxID=3038145 RepID=A0AC61QQP9_9BACT|nr:hypothetical protein [Palleniella muris]TGX82340.1 hypothetical protein E5358_07280 [Palleniella muris]
MKLDSTNSYSTAGGRQGFPNGILISEPEMKTGSEVDSYMSPDETFCESISSKYEEKKPSWSYLFVHHAKVKGISSILERDRLPFFVHKTIHYYRRQGKSKTVRKKEIPTVSGLIFLQGNHVEIQKYLDKELPGRYLCKNCSTGKVAEIPDKQMRPFMGLSESDPERIRFLLHPFHYYARNRILLRITSGGLEGLEGYVIRIDRDRRLVMDVGGMSVAISGVHAERFEVVRDGSAARLSEADMLHKRNLQERQALIDRYFHPVKTIREIAVQAENIEILRAQTIAELAKGKLSCHEALGTFFFIIEEIACYYAPSVEHVKDNMFPILQAGSAVLQEIDAIVNDSVHSPEIRHEYESDREQLMLNYGYLFDDRGV